MFLVNHIRKVGEVFFHFSLFIIFFYTKKSSQEHAPDAKAPTSRMKVRPITMFSMGIFLNRLGF